MNTTRLGNDWDWKLVLYLDGLNRLEPVLTVGFAPCLEPVETGEDIEAFDVLCIQLAPVILGDLAAVKIGPIGVTAGAI